MQKRLKKLMDMAEQYEKLGQKQKSLKREVIAINRQMRTLKESIFTHIKSLREVL